MIRWRREALKAAASAAAAEEGSHSSAHLERVDEIGEPQAIACSSGACARVNIGENVSERLDARTKFDLLVRPFAAPQWMDAVANAVESLDERPLLDLTALLARVSVPALAQTGESS